MEKQNVSSHISHLSTQFYKTKNIFVSFFKNWRIQLLYPLFGWEIYVFLNENWKTWGLYQIRNVVSELTRPWENTGLKLFWFPGGCPNSLVSKLINEWNKILLISWKNGGIYCRTFQVNELYFLSAISII